MWFRLRAAGNQIPRVPRDPLQIPRLRAYFLRPSPVYGFLVGCIGLLLVLAWLLSGPTLHTKTVGETLSLIFLGIPGCSMLAAGVFQVCAPVLYRSWRGLSDSEFDEQLNWDDAWLVRRGLEKVQLEIEEQFPPSAMALLSPPLIARCGLTKAGKSWDTDLPEARIRWVIRQDGDARFGVYTFAAVYFAQHHLGYYLCDYDVVSGVFLFECCADVHYGDIVALTATDSAERRLLTPLWWDGFFDLVESFSTFKSLRLAFRAAFLRLRRPDDFVARSFSVLLSSGGALNVPFPGFDGSGCGRHEESSRSAARGTLTQMRALLREKRQAIVRTMPADAF